MRKFKIIYHLGFACNNKCSYCYQHFLRKGEFKLDWIGDKKLDINIFDNLKKIIDYFLESGHEVIIEFIGGEPLLYKTRVHKILEFMKGYGYDKIKIGFITNGILINKEWFDLLYSMKFDLYDFQIALHSESLKIFINNIYRNKYFFLKFFKFFERSISLSIIFFYNYILRNEVEYYNNLKLFFSLLRDGKIKIRYISLTPVIDYVSIGHYKKKYYFLKKYFTLFKEYKDCFLNLGIYNAFDEKNRYIKSISILWDGRVYIGEQGGFNRYLIGSIFDKDIFGKIIKAITEIFDLDMGIKDSYFSYMLLQQRVDSNNVSKVQLKRETKFYSYINKLLKEGKIIEKI